LTGKNGTLLAADMMVDKFAGELNRGQKPNYVWTREKGVNQNLPFITDGPTIAPEGEETYPVTFTYYVWDDEAGKFIKKNHVVTALSGVTVSEVAPEVPPREGYTFTGWDKDIVPVSGDVVYNAVFTATLKTFEVVFLNDDGTELARGTYNYGETITDAPTEADVVAGKTGEYEYNPSWCSAHYENVYDGKTDEWVEKLERDGCYGLLTVFGNGLYMANVEYQVLFKDNNGSVLNSDWYVYGESLEYDADWVWQHYRDEVSKPSTVQYDYVWEGWLGQGTCACHGFRGLHGCL
jgi:hypothetical protein